MQVCIQYYGVAINIHDFNVFSISQKLEARNYIPHSTDGDPLLIYEVFSDHFTFTLSDVSPPVHISTFPILHTPIAFLCLLISLSLSLKFSLISSSLALSL
jgi:hypothetical protein